MLSTHIWDQRLISEKNKLKEIIKNGKAVINGWLQIPNSFSAEVMAKQGWVL